MKEYKLRYLPIAKDDLFEIINYIQDVLQNSIAAQNTLNKIETAILKRVPMGESFPVWQSMKKRKYPYRRINVGNYTVWYVVIDDVMEVRRIQPSNRNEENLLQGIIGIFIVQRNSITYTSNPTGSQAAYGLKQCYVDAPLVGGKKSMKIFFQVCYIISPGMLYITLFLIDFISKGNLVKIPILNFFAGINDKIPFGFLLNPFFIPCLIFSFLISIGWLLICKIKKFKKNKYFISLFSLLSFCASVIFSLLFIFIIGMYAILVKGEFM